MNDLYSAHITCLMTLYDYPYENKIGRQFMKASWAAAIGSLISHLPHPTRKGRYVAEGGHSKGFVASSVFFFSSPSEMGLPFLRGHQSHVKV